MFSSVQFSHSVMSNSLQPHELQHARPPCLYQLPEFTQTHIHWVGDAIQPSHPLSSPPAFNLSQHQSLFQWVNSSHQVTKVLELQLQHQSFQWIFSVDFLWTGLILLCKGLSRVFSSITIQKHRFFILSLLYGPTLISIYDYWKNHSFDYIELSRQNDVSAFEYTV